MNEFDISSGDMPGVNSSTPLRSSAEAVLVAQVDLNLLFVQLVLGEQPRDLGALHLQGALRDLRASIGFNA